MTILKPQVQEKKPDNENNENLLAEVVFDDLPEKKEVAVADKEWAPEPVPVFAIRRRRRVSAFAGGLLICIIITTCIGGIMLYKHLTYKSYRSGWCSTKFFEEQWTDEELPAPSHDQLVSEPDAHLMPNASVVQKKPPIQLDEQIEVDVDKNVEIFHIPRVGPYRPIQVVYDFEKNLSAIFDKDQLACFVKPLNRSLVKPPSSMLDFLLKLESHYYVMKSRVSRQDYYIEKPAVDDVAQFGSFIYGMCFDVPTFRLRKIEASPTPMAFHDEDDEGSKSSSAMSDDESSESSSEDTDDGMMMMMMNGKQGRRRHRHQRKQGRHQRRGGPHNRNKRSTGRTTCYNIPTTLAVEQVCV